MSTHSATQDLNPNVSGFDQYRKIKFEGLRPPDKPAATQAQNMRAEGQNTGSIAFPENKEIPAGYTFVGQWLAHDITMARNYGMLHPRLRLLTLYGPGPSAMTGAFANYPYDFDEPAMRAAHLKREVQYEIFRHAKFKIKFEGADQYDVPRLPNHIAVMADNRNDQHFILCQLHCAFARFHNALTEWLHYLNYPYALMSGSREQMKGQQLFTLAREITVWCYQRMLVEDYLPKLLKEKTLDLANPPYLDFKLFNYKEPPRLMPEFSMAAMRIGHSQTKEVYQVNRAGDRFSIFDKRANRDRSEIKDLRGFTEHESFHFEWDVFFEISNQTPQASAAIDHWIARPLTELIFRPESARNLAAINLERSEKLPAGEAIAEHAGFSLGKEELKKLGFTTENTPLWLYILLEAELKQKGKRLGELGSQIIAEQIMWVLRHDPMSKYSQEGSCDTLEKFVNQLFQRYDLEPFFGSADVLTSGLAQLGMNNEPSTEPAKKTKIQMVEVPIVKNLEPFSMAWIIKFPEKVAEQIEGLGKAMNDFHRNGPSALEASVKTPTVGTQKQTPSGLLKKIRDEALKLATTSA